MMMMIMMMMMGMVDGKAVRKDADEGLTAAVRRVCVWLLLSGCCPPNA